MKKFTVLALSFVAVLTANTQTLESAVKKTDNERYAAAEAEFTQLVANEPTNAKNFFYFGENYFAHKELDKANEQYTKGLQADPSSALNMVGQGKVMWAKGDTAAGRTMFKQALTITKNKDPEVMRQIAKALVYSDKKDLAGAVALLKKANERDGKNIEAHLIFGDALLMLTPKDAGPALQEYNTALAIDPKSAQTIVRKGQIYQRSKNYELANQNYLDAEAADPNYAPAYRVHGELNLLFNQSKKAAENFNKYLQLNNDPEARYRYATALFIGKNYCEVIPQITQTEAEGFSNFYTKRMLAYSTYECNNASAKTPEEYNKALAQFDTFFSVVPKENVLADDYATKGKVLMALGNDSLAILAFEQGLTIDTNNTTQVYSQLAQIYEKQKNYTKVVETYNRKAAGDITKLDAAENLSYGTAYYIGLKDYVQADSAFSRLTRQSPTYAIGYMWKARAEYKLDDPKNMKWLSAADYEQFLDTLTEAEKTNPAYKGIIMEACKYLGDYYVNGPAKDIAKAKVYWTWVEQLDPADKQAKAFFSVHR